MSWALYSLLCAAAGDVQVFVRYLSTNKGVNHINTGAHHTNTGVNHTNIGVNHIYTSVNNTNIGAYQNRQYAGGRE